MRVAITGAHGFLGWHTQCALLARGTDEIVPIGRAEYAHPESLALLLRDCDAVVHLAGVNRGTDNEVEEGNGWLASTLADAVIGSRVRSIVHGNSIHAGGPTPFGRSKSAAAGQLARAADKIGAVYTDVVLPNIFGEGGRPHYNSVVATFCHELVAGRRPTIVEDRLLPLLHAQDAADWLIDALSSPNSKAIRPEATPLLVSEVLTILDEVADYPLSGDFPDVSNPLRVALFNTFQSFAFPAAFPIDRKKNEDERGALFEAVRARRTDSLSFVSTTVPGAVRGQHFHRRKIERFLVLDGEAEIRLKKVAGDAEITFRVSGRAPQAVDMPPLWAHAIKNVGDSTLITSFWTNELLNPDSPDTFRYTVFS